MVEGFLIVIFITSIFVSPVSLVVSILDCSTRDHKFLPMTKDCVENAIIFLPVSINYLQYVPIEMSMIILVWLSEVW